MNEDVIDTIRALTEREPELARSERLLGGRFRLMDEDEYRAVYLLSGSGRTPFSGAEFRALRKRPGGHLFVDVAPEVQVSMSEVRGAIRGPFTPIVRRSGPPCFAWQVPAGELRVVGTDVVSRFAVSSIPIVAWS